MFKWVTGLIDRIFAAAGGVLFSQVPLYMKQYAQQLNGHVAELRYQVDAMRQAATNSGKTLEQFIQKFVDNPDVDFVRQGDIMSAMVNRWHDITNALTALQESSVITRPFVFMRHVNGDIIKSTWSQYVFGLPFTLEGLVYAVVGIICGFLIFYGIRKFFLALWIIIKSPFAGKSTKFDVKKIDVKKE
ncbi:MAG: DUF2937 family protein [Parachlamydiaceae bacterium]|nr:DUF2937 family protein [Parachlamydiaceae bacterium]